MRICIFCGGRANSREHAWPEWVLKTLGGGPRPNLSAMGWLGPDRIPVGPWTAKGRSGHLRVKHVCYGCNKGWMANLEEDAKPFVEPMMHDRPVPLDAPSQRIVATWCIKTAMVFECTRPTKPWFFSKNERAHLRSSLSIPSDTVVWLGCRGGHDENDILGSSSSTLYESVPKAGLAVRKAYVNTLYAGRLILQTITIRFRDDDPADGLIILHPKPGPWDRSLIQVWPVGPEASWPPSLGFTDDGLDFLRNRFPGPQR